MNEKIIVDINREVTIAKIVQWRTYTGLLEGLPTTGMNERRLADTMEEARESFGFDEFHLIKPEQTPIPYGGRYPFGEPAALPGITCIAILEYVLPLRDMAKDFSCLGIIWFQDDYAFPIDTEVLEKIKDIPFSKICGEFCY